MTDIVKICRKHGQLTADQVKKDGNYFRCNQCKIEKDRRWKENHRDQHNASACAARNEARRKYREGITKEEPKANIWAREDRKNNREKHRKYEQNYIDKYGIEHVRRQEVLRIHKITKQEHDELIEKQENRCAICRKEETRKGRSGDLAPLCIDHCHSCEKKGNHAIRGLLCHDCNSGIGKLRDCPDILRAALNYLEKHKHIE